MKDGFPLLTSKKMGIKNIASELEMFIKGIQDKRWLQERNNHIWDEWCNPKKVPYGNDEETKAKMLAEPDLGPIYGSQWVCFNGDSENGNQLKTVIETIKKDPTSRRLIISAWNPLQLDEMALPPCVIGYQFLCYPETNTIDIIWVQRSVDSFLGLPFDLAEAALFLMLICKETGYQPGKVIGMLGNCHIYENCLEQVKEQLSRTPHKLPTVEITNWSNIWDWKYTDFELIDYTSEGRLTATVAV
jgi:thymidylate synthase